MSNSFRFLDRRLQKLRECVLRGAPPEELAAALERVSMTCLVMAANLRDDETREMEVALGRQE